MTGNIDGNVAQCIHISYTNLALYTVTLRDISEYSLMR